MLDPSLVTRSQRGQSTNERHQRRVRNTVRRLNLRADDPEYLCVERGLRHSVKLGPRSQIPGYLPWYNEEEQLWELHSPRTQQRRAFQQQADFELSLEQYLEYIPEEGSTGAAASSTTVPPASPQPQQQPPADDFFSATDLEQHQELNEDEEEAEGWDWSFPPSEPPPNVAPKARPSSRPSSAEDTRRVLEELDEGVWAPAAPDTPRAVADPPSAPEPTPAPTPAQPFQRPPPEWLDQGGSPPSAEDPYTGPPQAAVAYQSTTPAQDNTLQLSTAEVRGFLFQRPSLRPQQRAIVPPTKRDRPPDPPDSGTSSSSKALGSIGSAAKRKLAVQQYPQQQRGQLSLGLRKPTQPKRGVRVTSWHLPGQPAPPPPPPVEGKPPARDPKPLQSPPQLARASLPRALHPPKVKVVPTQPPPPPTLGTTQQSWFGPEDTSSKSAGSGGYKPPPTKPKPSGVPKTPPSSARGSRDPPPVPVPKVPPEVTNLVQEFLGPPPKPAVPRIAPKQPAAPPAASKPPAPKAGPLTGGIVPKSVAFLPTEQHYKPPPLLQPLNLRAGTPLPHAREVVKAYAVDLHYTLDKGDEHSTLIPEAETLLRAVEVNLGGPTRAPYPWVCSYIGRSVKGTEQQRAISLFRRRQGYDRIAELAGKLGKQHCCSHSLTSVLPEEEWYPATFPCQQALYFGICDYKLYNPNFQYPHPGYWLNGKVSQLKAWQTLVLFDDSLDVARDCSSHGILCYHLTTSGSQKFFPEQFANTNLSKFHSWPSLASALEAFCSEFENGYLVYKLSLINPSLFNTTQ